jgi:thioredoxin-dependent peroxiredoxin
MNSEAGLGKKAPFFCLKDADGETACPNDAKGKWLVLYFYPKDNTPGCTLEAIDFSFLRKEFEAEGAIIYGISRDTCKSHQRFINSNKLTIRLLSDEDGVVAQAYGVWKKKEFMGKEFMGIARTTYLIDPEGVVRKVWEDVEVKGHADDVLSSLKAAKAASKQSKP